jgi:hypothetical protein
MDASELTDLVRMLAAAPSRRAVSRAIVALTAGSFLAPLLEVADAAGKKKHKRKRKKKKTGCKSGTKKCGAQCIPGGNCCTAADCEDDEACQNGACTATCVPQCTGKTCGDNGCGGSCGDCEGNESCLEGSCTTPPPTCSDGIKNGSETDIDCGGPTCPRCSNFLACASRDDCQSAFCAITLGTCQECSTDPDNCGSDDDGACVCDETYLGHEKVCDKYHADAPVGNCQDCPAGTNCVELSASLYCLKPCGAS